MKIPPNGALAIRWELMQTVFSIEEADKLSARLRTAFGRQLRAYREMRGLSRKQLAPRFGISIGQLASAEAGKPDAVLRLRILLKL